MRISLPKTGPNVFYYDTHVVYFRKILESVGIKYHLEGSIGDPNTLSSSETKFLMQFNDKKVLIDFSDHLDYLSNWDSFDVYFKYHYVSKVHGYCNNMHPFAPISFYDWEQYSKLVEEIKYTCNSDIVINMQQPGGAALERREKVQEVLKEEYKNFALLKPVKQVEYWRKINDCLVHVFVPGARNDMLDRGHMQYLAFGCCTIAPPIIDVLPYNEKIQPDLHYIQCKPDYSDLIKKIEWCKNNREKCVQIGLRAKKFFERSSTPQRLWDWILEKVDL